MSAGANKTLPEPRAIDAKRKAYAFERSLGLPMAEACRRAGGKVENGQATKWERSKDVQAWIAYYRALGPQDEEILAAKRERYEAALTSIAMGDGEDFPSKGEASPLDWPHRLNALAQLRDMNGLRAARRTELTGKNGGPLQFDPSKLNDDEIVHLERLLAASATGDGAETGEGGDRAPDVAPGAGGEEPGDAAGPELVLPDNQR